MKNNLNRAGFPYGKMLFIFIMRTFIFLFCATLFALSPVDVVSQNSKIKIEEDKILSVDQVFDLIMEQTEYRFFYEEGIFKDYPKVHLRKGVIRTNKLLKESLSQSNLSITVTANDAILIKKNPQKIIEEEQAEYQVSGTITDQDGQPLPGASVVEKGTDNGTQSDFDGVFGITVSHGGILEISYVGFLTQRITITQDETIKVQLLEDTASLEEVIVIGYGTAVKKDLTGAVSSFDQKAVDRQPSATNLTELMRGSLPGLNVGTSTGPSGESSIVVRGITSLGADNSPLLVVDDVIYQGNISSINPADIESVNVLKDASASSIYGSRAASGVIIITTKKGKEGKPIINLRSSTGFAHAGLIQEVYGPDNFLDYKGDVFDQMVPKENGYYSNPNNLPSGVTINDWLEYDGLGGTSTDPNLIWYDRLELNQVEKDNIAAGNTLDWKDLVYQTGLRLNKTISVSGKSDRVSYYGSLGHVKNEGIILFQESESLRGRLNIESKISNALTIGLNMQTLHLKQPTGIPGSGSYEVQSPFGSLFYDDGEIKHLPYDDALSSNPFLYTYRDNYFRQREYFTNLYAKLSLPLGFSYRVNWSNRSNFVQDYRFRPAIATLGDGGDLGSRSDQFENRWMVDNIVNWKKSFDDHNFDLTLLYNIEEAKTYESTQSNSIFSPNDNLSYHNLGIGENPVVGSNDTRATADAMMARLAYNFHNRYYVTAAVRRDGYSAFGANNPYATFPSIGLRWRLSDENFLKSESLNDLSLRASWGKNGNREIGIYSALSRLEGTNYIYDRSTVVGINATDLANLGLKWETTETYDVALEFSLFGSRVSGTLEYYQGVTNDLLLNRSLPILTGYTGVFANLGEVENKGFEISLNTVNIESGNFSWRSGLVLSHNRNKIKSLYGDMEDVLDGEGNVIGQKEKDDIGNDWYIGHAIDEIFDYKILGIWQLGEEDEATVYGRQPGDVKLMDVNEDGVINFDDQVFQGNRTPRYRASLRNDFVYKNFDFSIFANALLGHKGSNNEHFNFRVQQQRLNKIVTPYWTPDNPTNEWARLSSKNSSPATDWYDDKSFIRIQNISMGYTFPQKLADKLKIQSLRLYANVQNLPAFSLGGWEYGWDVETGQATPLITAIGFDLTF